MLFFILTYEGGNFIKEFFKGEGFVHLWLLLSPYKKIFSEMYGVKQPFIVIISLSRKIMSKSFLKNFFETYGKLHSLTVKIKMKKILKKLFDIIFLLKLIITAKGCFIPYPSEKIFLYGDNNSQR